MARLRQNFLSGTLDTAQLLSTDTVMNSAALQNALPVAGNDIMALVLDPASANPEVIYVVAHAAATTTATILRAQEGTTARTFDPGTRWAHGPTAGDIVPDPGASSDSMLRRLVNNLSFARTPSDQLRVNVDSGAINTNLIYWGNANNYPIYYSSGAPNSMDMRELMRAQVRSSLETRRNGRWVIT